MSLSSLRTFALLMIAFPVLCAAPLHAQAQGESLGDLARQLRAERLQNGNAQPRVITNDDIESRTPTAPPAAQEGDQSAAENGNPNTNPNEKKAEASADAKNEGAPSSAKKADKQLDAQEREMEKRTNEINKYYLDRIAGIREQIQTAQHEVARLLRDQLESSNNFQRSMNTSPSIPEYEQQQAIFNEQIKTQRDLLTSLNSQLQDAYEDARHAGVPHADE